MTNIGIFFASDTGNTEKVAEKIATRLELETNDIAGRSNEVFEDFDLLILGTPTANYGEMQPDWDCFVPELEDADLSGKKVALFGLGDQVDYPDSFQDAMGDLADLIVEAGGEIVGQWPTDGYEFNDSRAVRMINLSVWHLMKIVNLNSLTTVLRLGWLP